MPGKILPRVSSAHTGTLLQLFMSHFLVGAAVLLMARLGLRAALAALAGAMLGVIITWNISACIYVLELALERLTSSRTLELPAPRWHWPLTPLLARVNTLAATQGKLLVDPQTTTYRDQLARQVSKTAAQEERNRLARDLHDSIKQQIFSVVMSAAAVKARWESDQTGARRAVDDIERTAREAQVEMQALLQELRPVALENVGLVESLRMQCQALGYRTGAEVETELGELPTEDLLPPGSQELIFRIVQEGFANIARHARAQHVWLSLRQQDSALLVEIGDDGQGFSLEEQPAGFGGMGLTNIRTRASALGAQVAIWSQVGAGTTLHLFIPLMQELARRQEEEKDEQIREATSRAKRWLKTGLHTIELLAALVMLYTPTRLLLPIVSIGLPFAFWSWLWARHYKAQVALGKGRGSVQYADLQTGDAALLAGLLLVLLVWFGAFYSMFLVYETYASWFMVSEYICGILLVAAAVSYFFSNRRYYQRLPDAEVRLLTGRILRFLVVDALAWIFLLIMTLIVVKMQIHINLFYYGLLYLICWLLVIAGRAGQAGHWHKQAKRKAIAA